MSTNIPFTHPAIAVLRTQVEQRLGFAITSQQAIRDMEAALRFTINEDTLRRLWGFRQDGYATIRHSTLDILARYVGTRDWETFAAQVQHDIAPESDLVPHAQQLTADHLPVGTEVEISWLPDRTCRLRYEGDCRWTVIKVEHSTTLAEGDTFACRSFTVGQPAYLDDLIHLSQHYPACRLGIDHGLTSIKY